MRNKQQPTLSRARRLYGKGKDALGLPAPCPYLDNGTQRDVRRAKRLLNAAKQEFILAYSAKKKAKRAKANADARIQQQQISFAGHPGRNKKNLKPLPAIASGATKGIKWCLRCNAATPCQHHQG